MKLAKTVLEATLAVARFGLPESLSRFSDPGRVTLQTMVHAVPEAPPLSDAGCPLGLGFGFLLRKLEDARVGEVGHFPKHQQIAAPEAVRTLPLIAFFVETREGDVVPGLVFGSVAPYRSFDATDPDVEIQHKVSG